MKKPRILAIDDEASFMELLKQYFEPRGYEIDTASEGEKGLELIRKNKYDVVLLDLKMEGFDGYEVMKKIKQQHISTKIIFVTAYPDIGKIKEDLLSKGAFAFVEKPIESLKALEDIVNEPIFND